MLPLYITVSLPPSLSPFLPLSPSLPSSLIPSLPPSLPPFLPPSFPPSLPPLHPQLVQVTTPLGLGQYKPGYILVTTEAVYLLRRGLYSISNIHCKVLHEHYLISSDGTEGIFSREFGVRYSDIDHLVVGIHHMISM